MSDIKTLIKAYQKKKEKVILTAEEYLRRNNLLQEINTVYLQMLIPQQKQIQKSLSCHITKHHEITARLTNGCNLYEGNKMGCVFTYSLNDFMSPQTIYHILHQNRTMWNKAHTLGLAPKLHDEYYCFILDTVEKFVLWEHLPNQVLYNVWKATEKSEDERKHVMRLIQSKITKMNKHNIVHGNLYTNYIVLTLKDKRVVDVAFINFNDAGPVMQDMRYKDDVYNDYMYMTNYVTRYLKSAS